MKPLVIATGNAHKTEEFEMLMGGSWRIEDLTDHPGLPSPEETGTSFLENATIKALSASRILGPEYFVLADDSGLEVDALGGAPGVHSARYAGPKATDAENRAKLLRELAVYAPRGSKRSARFRCVLVLAQGNMVVSHHHGTVEGILADQEMGEGGFGYDSLFIPEGFSETFAQLPASTKNTLSHRARAVAAFQNCS